MVAKQDAFRSVLNDIEQEGLPSPVLNFAPLQGDGQGAPQHIDGVQELKNADKVFREYFKGTDSFIVKVIRVLFSMPASGSAVERVFSVAGRLDAPLRSRMSAGTLTRLLVVQQYLKKRPGQLSSVVGEVEAFLARAGKLN